MRPSDLARMRLLGTPTVSPDGRHAVVALTRIDLDADDYTAQLWLVPTDGASPARQLTHGWRDTAPVYSPDGRWLAFLRASRVGNGVAGPDTKPQLYVMPTAGGEPRRLTAHPLGAGAPAWSPDSTRLAYVARVPEPGRYGTDEKVTPDKEPPRRITRLRYRLDDFGFTLDRRAHVFVVDATAEPSAPPVQLTEGDYDHQHVRWSPDGRLLTFVSARHASRDDDLRSDVFVCAPDGSGLRALTHGGLSVANPTFSPDGGLVCFTAGPLGPSDRFGVCRNEALWCAPADGSAPPRRLTDQERYNLVSPGGMIVPVEDGVLFPTEHRGAVHLLRVPYSGDEPTVLVDGHRQVTGVAAGGGTVVVSVTDPHTWGELAVLGPDGALRTLTDFNAEFGPVLPQVEVNATAPDGYPVHGWVVMPRGDGPHPVLLMIHGGPFSQYGWRLFDEAQVYAAAGYAVVMGNPRGSSGYGEAHGRAVIGNVGEVSAADLLALLDTALGQHPSLDRSRVGVLGGSHGGFMTTWLAAHHGDRFKAAISERALNAIDSFTGSSDIGWFFSDDLYGTDVDQQAKQSPLTYADRISIPFMIIHSEQDWRCPVEQAQRLFVILKRRGVPVEFLLFPGEGHELSRSGLPSHRVARFEAILDWWARHL
ncbi:MAG: S9 family peptidase [Micromonosporaceae bacterium]